jgi:hypothetical protein
MVLNLVSCADWLSYVARRGLLGQWVSARGRRSETASPVDAVISSVRPPTAPSVFPWRSGRAWRRIRHPAVAHKQHVLWSWNSNLSNDAAHVIVSERPRVAPPANIWTRSLTFTILTGTFCRPRTTACLKTVLLAGKSSSWGPRGRSLPAG